MTDLTDAAVAALGNLDATQLGSPFLRVLETNVRHLAKNTFQVRVVWQRNILTTTGDQLPVGAEFVDEWTVTPDMMAQQIQLRHPVTGVVLGLQMTYGQLVSGVYSAALVNLVAKQQAAAT